MNAEHLVGTVLNGRYEILEVMGIGGMAVVYKAKCRVLNRFVAVKMLKDSLSRDDEVLQRFKIESLSTAKMSHPNIVGIYDVGNEKGSNYIVMELVDGITLNEYISRKGALDWEEACNIAMQIGLALQCAHENSIIHRDIKPHNILITKDNTIKVADFGIARAVSNDTMITGKETMGSVRYISPEQARGGYVDVRSDIYSLGVVLYEMLTGKVPFDCDNPVSIAMMKLNDKPVSCKELNPNIPDSVADITMRAISKEQHYRYQTAIDMVTDLKAVLDGGQVKAYDETSTIYSGRKGSRNNKEDDDLKSKKKSKTVVALIVIIATLLVAAVLGVLAFNLFSSPKKEMIDIPNLLGMTVEEAEKKANEVGLKIDMVNITYENDTTGEYEKGMIMRQDPDINRKIEVNTEIKITVSKGIVKEGEFLVPSVVDETYDDAKKQLEELGLIVSKEEEASDTVEEGIVLRQTPEEGEIVKKNSKITLVVSSGAKDAVKVPDCVGDSYEDAREELIDLGLKVLKEEEESETVEEGKVISQTPEGGEKLMKDENVILVVSTGSKDSFKAPSVKGDKLSDAKKTITDLGLKVQVVEVEDEDNIGRVISQDPSENTKVKKGDTITIKVGVKPEKEEEPTTPSGSDEKNETKIKYLTIPIPQEDDDPDSVQIRVVANGKEIHNEEHKKSEQEVILKVEVKNDITVQVYFDGKRVQEKEIEF